MTIHFGTSGWRAVVAAESLPAGDGDGDHVGELINEDKIILGVEESAESSIKDHYPEKDGILACLLAAEAVAASAPPLSEQLSSLYARPLRLESGRIGERRAPELMPTLKVKLRQEPNVFRAQNQFDLSNGWSEIHF